MFDEVEGIILKAIDYQETKRILTVFTPNGLLSFIAYLSKKQGTTALTQPLTLALFTFKKATHDLLKIKEISLLDTQIAIRSDFDKIQSAGVIVQSLLKTQLPHKPSNLLYQLVKAYLKQLQSTQNTNALTLSFLLKVLRHEGLYAIDSQNSFTQEEGILLKGLAFTKDFALIESIPIEDVLLRKIRVLFEESF